MSTETESNINLNSLNDNDSITVFEAMGDWNDYGNETGFYTGHAMKNSPCEMQADKDYWYVINICMSINSFATQTAINAFSKETFIRNKENGTWKEWSKLGNGCDADTVDGKHASDFAPSGFGLGTFSKPVAGDWNNYILTGFYHGHHMSNQPPTPDGSNSLWFVISTKFTDDRWCTQVAFNFENTNLNYIRKKVNNTWSQWEKLGNGGIAETISSILPIEKGGTGAENVIGALKNLNLSNNTFNNVPSCSPLMYKNYTDFGLESMRTFDLFRKIPEHSFFVFENNKKSSACITDAPYNLGILFMFKGYVHDCHAMFFSGQGDNGNVYHYLCNREVVLCNWTKINDKGNADTLDGKDLSDLIQKHGIIYNAVADDIKTSGEYYIQGGTGFPPSKYNYCGWLKVEEGYDANFVKQTTSNVNDNTSFLYQRFLIKNKWTDWTRVGDGCNASTLNNHDDTYFATASSVEAVAADVNDLKTLVIELTKSMNNYSKIIH